MQTTRDLEFLQANSKQVCSARLRAFDLFSELPEGDLDEIARSCQEKVIPAGTMMIRQGQVGQEIFFLEEGEVCVFKKGFGSLPFSALVRGPDVLGERALMDPERIRTANVEARTNLRLIVVQIATFIGFLRRHPTLGRRIKQMVRVRLDPARREE